MVLLGTSGAGKTFTLQLIALRMRRKGTQVFIIAPLKGHEFLRACNNIGGEFISISPASKQCINVCEIRKQDLSANQLIDGVISENSILAKKIQQLHIFFSLLIPDISHEERQLLDEALIRTYSKKGITHNNESLIDPEHPDRYREMPLLGDIYEILMESPETRRMGKPASLGVTIKKSGNYEVQSGQSMSYDFSGIANTSNVALNHFFWHDRIPTDATRALSISTGTYNARLYYKVTFKTNLNDYRTLASNLQTSNNYSLSLNAATLRLAQGEYVTDVRFEFGTVPSGFSSVVKPTMRVQVLGTVSNGYQIINRADVGGQYLNEWQTAKTTWVTTVRRFNTTPLPKTGY